MQLEAMISNGLGVGATWIYTLNTPVIWHAIQILWGHWDVSYVYQMSIEQNNIYFINPHKTRKNESITPSISILISFNYL